MSDRDLIGYGASPPDPQWPGGARLALSFVLNYEEGGERTPLEGDPESESFLHEVVGAPPTIGRPYAIASRKASPKPYHLLGLTYAAQSW